MVNEVDVALVGNNIVPMYSWYNLIGSARHFYDVLVAANMPSGNRFSSLSYFLFRKTMSSDNSGCSIHCAST
jgi:hypothetical protein